jgi:A/G-specific adenine glycosylase
VTSQRRKIAAIVSRLLEWFSRNARDLPWRQTTDPYGIWVSEIMLQQTQVKTVLPYWERWMRALPTVESLANERAERLHKLWEGLGYYRRVRNMHRAARVIMQEHGGKFPREFDQILALPGVGRYTAGAITSIAFNQPRPVLDGNVMRVLCRCFGITSNPRVGETNKRLWRLADELVGEAARSEARVARPCSQLNQALMELGALVCLPRGARCGDCPLAKICVARRQGRVEALPNLGRKAAATPRRFLAFVAERNGRYLVRQRPAEAINGLLWEFPNVETAKDERNLRRAARQALGIAPDEISSIAPFCVIKHSITRYRITVQAFRVKLGGAEPLPRLVGKWMRPKQLGALPFASAHRKILMLLKAAGEIAAPRAVAFRISLSR